MARRRSRSRGTPITTCSRTPIRRRPWVTSPPCASIRMEKRSRRQRSSSPRPRSIACRLSPRRARVFWPSTTCRPVASRPFTRGRSTRSPRPPACHSRSRSSCRRTRAPRSSIPERSCTAPGRTRARSSRWCSHSSTRPAPRPRQSRSAAPPPTRSFRRSPAASKAPRWCGATRERGSWTFACARRTPRPTPCCGRA